MESVMWGEFETSGNEIKMGEGFTRNSGSQSGQSIQGQLSQIVMVESFSFLDHLHCGLHLNFLVSIDFTGSNGNPAQPSSLHYRDVLGRPNQYQNAISSVGTIIQDYDSDKMFPVFGFGAKTPPSGHVSHMFPCNFNPQNPFVHGVHGILEVYNQVIPRVQLYGPTNFAPTINESARMAQSGGTNSYFITLILTDGAITDMQSTIDAIVQASYLPLSIIIIGVGEADFDAMDELDGDDGLLVDSSGRRAQRDIVQFVPMVKFGGDQARLTTEVLAEVPGQVEQWARANNVKPNFNFVPAPQDASAPPPYAG